MLIIFLLVAAPVAEDDDEVDEDEEAGIEECEDEVREIQITNHHNPTTTV
jgi:hypothetical protein